MNAAAQDGVLDPTTERAQPVSDTQCERIDDTAPASAAPQSGHDAAQSGHGDKRDRLDIALDNLAKAFGNDWTPEQGDAMDAVIDAARSAMGETWRPMMSAPLDGTEIEILFEHFDYWTCLKLKGKERADKEYRAAQRAHWIDHNGGGWTWYGMAGSPVGWRPISNSDRTTDRNTPEEPKRG